MGDWKELDNIPEGNDPTLYKIPKCKIPPHDYDNVFTISSSKQKYGNPTLNELCNLLVFHCSEIELLRNKPNIGYYADSGSGLSVHGYRDIHKEDIKHLQGSILQGVATKSIDFILSSPGGWIEPAAQIIEILRRKFSQISMLLPGSTYSAASMIALCGNEIIMESFTGHMAPINPRINGFDTYVAKQIYWEAKIYSWIAPWSLKHLNEARVLDNGVTMKTLKGAEKFVKKTMVNTLAKYVFQIDKLSLFEKIKMKYKVIKIVNFMADFKNHLIHTYPLMPKKLKTIGIPARNAEAKLDVQLRIIRNICEDITLSRWDNGQSGFYVRKVFFSGKDCYTLGYVP